MTLQLKELTPAEEILAFLDDIEGDGYGGMAMFEIARQHAREMVRNASSLTRPDTSQNGKSL